MITFAKLFNHKYFSILLFFFVVFEKNFLSTALFVFFASSALENGREDGLLKLRLTFATLCLLRAKRTHKGETTRIRSLSDKRIPWTKMKSTREAEKKQNRR